MQEKWKSLEASVLKLLNEGKKLDQIAKELEVDKSELRLFMHRYRKFRVSKKDNLVIRLLTELITYPEYFQPNENFYKSVRIGQRRWWQLYKGEKRITENEYRAFCEHMKVPKDVAMKVRQLDLFDNAL